MADQSEKASSAAPAPSTASANEGQTSWWRTIPGMLTAAAGLITALTGLVIALDKIGIFEDAAPTAAVANTPDPTKNEGSPETPSSPPESPTASNLPAAPSEDAQAEPPAKDGEAPARSPTLVATMTDGTSMNFQTDSWTHRGMSTLDLDNGLSISLNTIRAIDFADYTGGDKVAITITMNSGQIVKGRIEAGASYLYFEGANDVGKLTMRTDKLRRIGPPPRIRPDLIKVKVDRAQLVPAKQ
jgi:hypothetical protein